jgi:predicted ATPase
MLEQINLRNYRGFAEHRLALRPFTVAVGQNNAGKSTVVEALRLLAIVTERYRYLPYKAPPEWADIPLRNYGVSPSLKGTELNFATLYHRYGPPPAIVEATFSRGETVTIYLGGNEEIHAVITRADGEIVRSKAESPAAVLPLVSAMPQLSPVSPEEALLTEDYIRSALSSPLASRHFRNQLHVLRQFFDEFRAVAEDNWLGLQVRSLDVEGRGPDARLFLQVRNQDFVGEVGLMGHGLQMWLQVIWFLTRSRGAHTVILDEPDVYMHPDLQRRLVRYLSTRFQQIVLTTHSVEIMSEVPHDQILIIDRKHDESAFADGLDAVQRVLSGIGSAQNIHLTRLWGQGASCF